VATDTITISQLLDEWYEWKRSKLACTSRAATVNAIKILKADLGDVLVDALRVRHVDAWYTTAEERGYAPLYAKKIMAVLSSCYSTAVRWDIAAANPVKFAEAPKPRGKVKAPSSATVKRAITYARLRDPQLWCYIRLAATTGARRSELLGLRREDFAADVCQITIRRTVVRDEHGVSIVDATKSERGARTISIDRDTAHLIEKCLAQHDSPWLFYGRDRSQPMYPSSITHRVTAVGKALGVHLHLHQLRHYVATELLRAGVPVTVVAGRLGDAPATIMSIYGHSIPADDAAVAESIASALN
jgi:integrase